MRLAGITAAVPKTSVASSAAYEHFPKAEVDRIVANLGIERHREVMPGQTAIDLCIAAGNGLLEHMKWPRESVDVLIVVSQTPDHPMPGSSHRVHKELGLRHTSMCFDVTLGCSGFTHGMIIARSFLNSGYAKRALLLCADTGTHRFHTGIREARREAELGNAILCGDGAGAVALEAEGPDQWRADAFGADGSGYQYIHIPGGAHKSYWGQELLEYSPDKDGKLKRPIDLQMQGADVFSFTIRRVPPMVDEVLKKAGWSKDDVDVAVFHQANKFIMEFLRKKLGLPPEKVPYSIEEYGNTSSASIPLTMRVRAEAQLAKPTKWLLLGFGAGLSWSGIALETDHVETAPIVEI